jgi:hypothetical protein
MVGIIVTFIIENKGLQPAFLARVNIVNPTSLIFRSSAHYKIAYNIRSSEEVESLAHKFFHILHSDEEYRIFRAVALLVGTQSAVAMAEAGQFTYPQNLDI